MAAVMIGVDPHKGSHTAVAIGAAEEPLGQVRVRASTAQAERLLAWAAPWPQRTWAIEGAGGLACGQPPADAAGDQLAQHRVKPAHHLSPCPAQVPVPLGPHLQHHGMVIGPGRPASGRTPRRDRHRTRIIRVVLVGIARGQQPDPGAQLGGTSRTHSPAATSCWARRCPSPPAPSTAQVRSGQAAAQATSFPA